MNPIDLIFLALFLAILVVLLVGSRVIRAIAWDSIRHPFTRGRIMITDDEIKILRDENAASESPAH